MKKIFKIVLTGGPCAGKTTALNRLMIDLSERNFKVLIVPEVPTELFKTGMLIGETGVNNKIFQEILIESQMTKEKLIQKYAENSIDEKIVIICDRGLLDPKAYCSDEEYGLLMNDMGLSESNIRDSYDAVFHLKTAADGAVEYYTTENNEARKETPEEAINLDKKTINAWTGHPKLKIIDNSTPFKEKMDKLIESVFEIIDIPNNKHNKKVLIERPILKELENLKAKKVEIIQSYLEVSSEKEIRLRRRTQDGSDMYFLTTKIYKNKKITSETTSRISEKEYLNLIFNVNNLKFIKKDRYYFCKNDIYYQLDVIDSIKEYSILEFANKELIIPNEFYFKKDVSNDPNYKNYNLLN